MFIPENKDVPGEDTVQILTFDSENTPRKEERRKSSLNWSKSCRVTTVQVVLVAVFMPLLCAAVGACVDFIIYGPSPENNLSFHARYMAYSCLVVVPLVLVRIAASKYTAATGSNRVVNIVDFCIYIILTVAVGVALPRAMLAGPDAFHAADHARNIFSANGMFDKIRTEEDVYNWLTQMMYNMYDNPFPSNKGSRSIDKQGRALLFCSLRLRQSRVKPINCSDVVGQSGFSIGTICYPPFSSKHEDKDTYSSMNFTYYNSPYRTFHNRLSYASDTSVFTVNAGSFSLAGFWTMFSPDATRNDTVNQIRDMREANWIDQQTRLVGIDATVVYPDFQPNAIMIAIQMNVAVTPSGKFLPQPASLSPNYLPVVQRQPSSTITARMTEDPKVGFAAITPVIYARGYEGLRNSSLTQGTPDVYLTDVCAVVVGSLYLVPFYLGIFCAFVYTLQIHVLLVIQDWRMYVQRFFTYTELLWMLMLVLSLVFWCLAGYLQACSYSVLVQDPFPSATGSLAATRTGAALRLELQSLSIYWAQARNVLGFALFLHLFNFLKFLVKFKSLGALIRTLSRAAPELLSFSVSFFVIFIAFVTMFFILFSVDAKEFMSYERSTMSLWLGMLGELEVTDALWRNRAWSLPMIILFTFVSVFVLLTTIVAIVSNAHEKTQVASDDDDSAVLREQRLVDAVMKALTRHGRSQKVHPSSLEVTNRTNFDDAEIKLLPFREPLRKWASDARGRVAARSMNPTGTSVPAEGQRKRNVPKVMYGQDTDIERSSML